MYNRKNALPQHYCAQVSICTHSLIGQVLSLTLVYELLGAIHLTIQHSICQQVLQFIHKSDVFNYSTFVLFGIKETTT